MTPRQVLESKLRDPPRDEDGRPIPLTLAPGLTPDQLAEFSASMPGPLPAEVRELLAFASGLELGGEDPLDFTGGMMFEFAEALPHGVPIMHDGSGNFWVVDVDGSRGAWGDVFYACHDPPVLALQAHSLAEFLVQVLAGRGAPGDVEDVTEHRVFDIWRSNPGAITMAAARGSGDRALAQFAAGLSDDLEIFDLRERVIGSGFAWGRARAEARVVRMGSELVFAAEKAPPRRSLFGWLRRGRG
jgi:cell wall assembly regulator SMI1